MLYTCKNFAVTCLSVLTADKPSSPLLLTFVFFSSKFGSERLGKAAFILISHVQMSLVANESIREFIYKSFDAEKKEEESVKIKIIDVSTFNNFNVMIS